MLGTWYQSCLWKDSYRNTITCRLCEATFVLRPASICSARVRLASFDPDLIPLDARAPSPPPGPISFIFMQFLEKNLPTYQVGVNSLGNLGSVNILKDLFRIKFFGIYRMYRISRIITARVRSTREGAVFTGVCLLTFREGVPHPRSGGTPSQVWGVPHLRSGGTPSQVWTGRGGGYPIPGLDGGVPHPRSGWGGTPSQVWMGLPHPRSGQGVPHPRVPHRPGLDGNPPHHDWMGYPPIMTGWGIPPTMAGWGNPPPIRQSIASTCYAAGGMPLAEDFLVFL